MSIAKLTKDIIGEKEKRTRKFNGETITEGLLIIFIIVTSFNLVYWVVPTFLCISFLLLQVRKIVNNTKKVK